MVGGSGGVSVGWWIGGGNDDNIGDTDHYHDGDGDNDHAVNMYEMNYGQ